MSQNSFTMRMRLKKSHSKWLLQVVAALGESSSCWNMNLWGFMYKAPVDIETVLLNWKETPSFLLVSQVLKSMTTFLAGTPSASWLLQAAGPTSPAWARAPQPAAEEEMQICERMAFSSWWGQEAASPHLKPWQHLSEPSFSLNLTIPPFLLFFVFHPPILLFTKTWS